MTKNVRHDETVDDAAPLELASDAWQEGEDEPRTHPVWWVVLAALLAAALWALWR